MANGPYRPVETDTTYFYGISIEQHMQLEIVKSIISSPRMYDTSLNTDEMDRIVMQAKYLTKELLTNG